MKRACFERGESGASAAKIANGAATATQKDVDEYSAGEAPIRGGRRGELLLVDFLGRHPRNDSRTRPNEMERVIRLRTRLMERRQRTHLCGRHDRGAEPRYLEVVNYVRELRS